MTVKTGAKPADKSADDSADERALNPPKNGVENPRRERGRLVPALPCVDDGPANLCSSLNDPYASEASSPFPNNEFLNFVQFLKFPCFTKSNESVIQYYTAPQISSKLIFKRGRFQVGLELGLAWI